MKKSILLFLLIPLLFATCSKDDKDGDSLDGTTWEAYEVDGDYTYKSTIKFHKSTYDVVGYEEYTGESGSKINFSSSGTYTYIHPKVVMKEDVTVFMGTISGNKMIVVGEEEIEYLKK